MRDLAIAGICALVLTAIALLWIPSIGNQIAAKIGAVDDEEIARLKEVKRKADEANRAPRDGAATPGAAPRR